MRWYQKSTVVHGVIGKNREATNEMFLVIKDSEPFCIVNTDESRGLEKYMNHNVYIEGRVKVSSDGIQYLWVDRWWSFEGLDSVNG